MRIRDALAMGLVVFALILPIPALSMKSLSALPANRGAPANPGPVGRFCSTLESRDRLGPQWAYRMKLVIDADSIEGSAPLVDFPLLLSLNGSNTPGLFLHAKTDGSDIVITKQDGITFLHREIVSYDSANQSAEIWLRADTLSRQDNVFYMYYANPDTTIFPADGTVWDQNHLAVYHFAEDPAAGLLQDYGLHANNGAALNGWTSEDRVPGAIGRGWRFNGTTDWVSGAGITSADSTFTVSVWLSVWNQENAPADLAFHVEDGYWGLAAMRTTLDRNPVIGTQDGEMSWMPGGLPDTLLHNFLWRMDGVDDTVRFFFDGREQSVYSRWAPNPPYKIYTGEHLGGSIGIVSPCWGAAPDLFQGVADEFRVYEGLRSPEWILTDYRNQREGSDFIRYEPEEPTPVLVSGLEAASEEGGIAIEWTAMEGAFSGFYVDRRPAGSTDDGYVRLNPGRPLPPRGTSRFLDREIEAGADYEYRIEGVTIQGDTLPFGPVRVAVPDFSLPIVALGGANPGHGPMHLVVRLPHRGHALLVISDSSGRRVRTIWDQDLAAGVHEVDWDGRDEMGRPGASGVYFARLLWSGRSIAKKLIVMH